MDRFSLEKKFKTVDIDKDGFIEFDEFKHMMINLFHTKTDDEEIVRLFGIMDKDKNGKITLEEFISGMNPSL